MQRRDALAGMMGLLASAGASAVRAAVPAQSAADDFVRGELAAAKAEGKTLALYFHASWCSYCKLFDMFLADPKAAPIFNARFRLARMRVREEKAKYKAQQLTGVEQVFGRFSPGNIAVPLMVFLNPDGSARAKSLNDKGKNIGFPVADWELDWFEIMLSRAAPDMSANDIAALRNVCVRIYKK
ncbi:MAG: thioredoxin family protein [Caulobacterales bacterium]